MGDRTIFGGQGGSVAVQVSLLGPYTITFATPADTEFGAIPAGSLLLECVGFLRVQWNAGVDPALSVYIGADGNFDLVQSFLLNNPGPNDPDAPYSFAALNVAGNVSQPKVHRAEDACVLRTGYFDVAGATIGSIDIYILIAEVAV